MEPPTIVSLVPSLTELVCWLGARDRLVGRTQFCTEPRDTLAAVPAIGGTKDPDVAAILTLRPGLVVANREENRREDVEALQVGGLDVLVTDPNTLEGASAMIRDLGMRLGRASRAQDLARDIEQALTGVAPGSGPRVFVAVWRKPLLGLGAATYAHDLIERCGAVNVLRGRERYPAVSMEELAALQPDLLLLPDEPYRFTQRHIREFAAVGSARVIDGKVLWWYGPRMPESIQTLRAILGAVQPQSGTG